jgi:acetoacetyl-CoA reductase/3-oxoacyl-[acyl-carrier protein] reductase
MLGFEDKVVFVTGGNRGIGAAIVKQLEDLGAKVAYNYRSSPGEAGTLPIQANVTDRAEMEAAFDQVESELGPIYGIVCNAGITRDALASKLDYEDWDKVIDVDLTGVWNSVRPVLPKMYERGTGGSLVLVSSIVGERGNIGQANYAAAKGGVIALAKTLAAEGARYDVRANVVAPGFIETDMTKDIPDKVKEKIHKQIPMRRFGKPEEIAWAVTFLLSPEAGGFITGATLSVNGGHYM